LSFLRDVLLFHWPLIEHDLDAMAGVPVAEALRRVLADRQVSPTVLSSGLFRHERSLRGKFDCVNSVTASFQRGQQRAAFPVPSAGSRRKNASRRRAAKAEGLAPLQDAARDSEAIGKRASVVDCPPSA